MGKPEKQFLQVFRKMFFKTLVKMKIKLEKPKTDGTRSFWLSRFTFVICFFVSVGLIVGGFFVPPMGVIDGSVLTSVGELLLFPTLLYGYRAIELGMKVRFQKGSTSIEIHKDEQDQPDIEPVESEVL